LCRRRSDAEADGVEIEARQSDDCGRRRRDGKTIASISRSVPTSPQLCAYHRYVVTRRIQQSLNPDTATTAAAAEAAAAGLTASSSAVQTPSAASAIFPLLARHPPPPPPPPLAPSLPSLPQQPAPPPPSLALTTLAQPPTRQS